LTVQESAAVREDLIEIEPARFALRRSGDVGPALEANKRALLGGDGYTPSRDLRRVASIPPLVQLLWIERYGADPLRRGNEDLLRRLLNDPEWAHLRTAPGRV
jgi:hypothetical protein